MAFQKGRNPHNFNDLTGQRFGRLMVVSRAENKGNMSRWNCVCDCGNETVVYSNNLRRGFTQSCGCYRHKCEAERAAKKRTHGEGNGKNITRLYRIWTGMNTRCFNEKSRRFEHYGGRGITVCDEWRNDYIAFRDWAMSNGYEEHLTLDRIDNDGNYCPENCRWATAKEQANNRRSNRLYTISGETKTVKEWAEYAGIEYSVVIQRLNKGICIETALLPVQNNLIVFDGKAHTMTEWSKITGIPYDTIKQRIRKLGWSVERALTQKKRGRCNV